MGYTRFWRRKKIAPGMTLNLSKSGLSASFGRKGAHYTVGHGRRRATVGIPGTGVYYTSYSKKHARRSGNRGKSPARRATPTTNNSQAINDLFRDIPSHKIAWGIVLTLLVITSPIGVPLLLTGLIQL